MSKKNKRKNTVYSKVKKWLCRIIGYSLLFFVGITLLFRFMPVPFSAYMAQQKIMAWVQGDFTTKLDYQWVSLDNIAWQMQLAVIAAEDQKFFDHYGFDWQAIKSAVKNNQNSMRLRGGSSLSQQTAKNLYLWHGQSWLRKGLEVPTTLVLESLWSKQRILEVYLNIAEFGEGIFGVEAASQHYFNKSAKQLNQQEAALLAAVLPNPIIYQVNRPSAYVLRRQAWILQQMNQLGGKSFLTQQ
ncbi:monofunctional biosynthetic peptidoglycan transglycosylase [Volucribacter amazonae]|uniref:Biosynthetic peptidoglycan transglycosylase n=1 Tax=Volucribacter amazonae TaxID=256731 RepID=A0A9X4PCR9_9PAST|nr:monofunctional biosynthetic peptidoglycan transglycosylase [Volucribacter amazonae]MDG6894981.1 monofunctional biosynthetic peptidoglycan transglycosylase [Volucribacter amazonae]